MPLHVQLAALAMLALLVFGIRGWIVTLLRWRQGIPVLPVEPRKPVPWTLLDIILVGVGFVLAQAGAAVLLRAAFAGQAVELDNATPQQLVLIVGASGLANLTTGVAALAIASVRAGASWNDLGMVARELPHDISIGVSFFFLLALPVFTVQAVLTQWFPYEHPLIDILRDQPDPTLYVVSVIVAVAVAPLVEELLFRVVLQGWLEKLPPPLAPNPSMESVTSLEPVSSLEKKPLIIEPDPPYWPIGVSAALFAVAHWGHGAAPIPLFLLAIGLGYLYRQTHRIAPSITVHLLLNALSMAMLWLEIRYGAAA